ncbi:beta-galactosidase BgaA [Abditibacteriota bacterium]|nr:beta-galactosidase BgaA [Abditibacteriota bacterium]
MSNPLPRHQRPSRLNRFLFGTAYYPEQWTPADRENDTQRMAQAGMNVVRMAEFAWDVIEPRRGEFDFSLFDATIARMADVGIETILCTPTAAPPRWLTAQNPQWMRVDAEGRRMRHGSRQHVCTNNPGFRAESQRITRAMAEHFQDSPHVIGWQTDNEFFCHFSECYCDACTSSFRQWLRGKYSDVNTLNRAWGTAFWAQTYDDFEQIELPLRNRPTHPNPSQELDYYRFLSDAIGEFQRGQVEILRETQPNWWVTHNGLFEHIDYWKLRGDLDFLGVDIYPGFVEQPRDFSWASLKLQQCRAASGSFIVPEQQGGAGGQLLYLHQTPAPGQMRLWAYQAIAHGADGILHFRWRTARFGAEMYWNGILDHDNVARRRYAEFSQEGRELERIGTKILGTVVDVRAAILTQTDQDEAHATMTLGLPGPQEQTKLIFRQMLVSHWPAGLVDAADSFAGLKLLVVPSFVVMDEELAARLQSWVENGGILVASARTATRNRDNHVSAQTPPGLLGELFGVTVEEFGTLPTPLLNLKTGDETIQVGAGYEILRPRGAQTLATWSPASDGSPHAATGEVALTLNRFGQGAAIYVGSYFSEQNTAPLLALLREHAPIESLGEADELIEITCRHCLERRLTFALNHTGQPQQVRALPAGLELISSQMCGGVLELAPYGVAIIETRL